MGTESGSAGATKDTIATVTATPISWRAKEEGGWLLGGEEKSEKEGDEAGPRRTKFNAGKESDI